MPPRRDQPARETTTLTLADKATETLRQAILDLTIEPSARLDERFLQERLSISRTPAREAMNRLQAEGLLELRPGQGVHALPLGLDEINHFFDAYFAEEKMIAFFCDLEDRGMAADLVEINRQHGEAQRRMEVNEIQRLNKAFHLRMAQSTRNPHVLMFSRHMHDHAQRLTYFIYKLEGYMQADMAPEHGKIQHHHEQIIVAVKQKDRSTLSDAMTEHAKQFHDRVARILTFNRGEAFSL